MWGWPSYLEFLFSGIQKIIRNKTLDMEVIVNNKTLENGMNVIQLETAVGAAMKCFDNAIGKVSQGPPVFHAIFSSF